MRSSRGTRRLRSEGLAVLGFSFLNLVSMIRLDAATVLLQWAAGGLFFLWFTTRRREVGLGYGWLLRGTYLLLVAVGALVRASGSAWCRCARPAPSRASWPPAWRSGSRSCARAGVSGADAEHDRRSERVAAMTGIERTVTAPAPSPCPRQGVPAGARPGRAVGGDRRPRGRGHRRRRQHGHVACCARSPAPRSWAR